MIKRFHVLYVGQVELENIGLQGTPATPALQQRAAERAVFVARDVAQLMDELGYTRCGRRSTTSSTRGTSASRTSSSSRSGSPPRRAASSSAALHVVPMCTRSDSPRTTRWRTSSPTARDHGRGTRLHSREVETFGAPVIDQAATRAVRGADRSHAQVLRPGEVQPPRQAVRVPAPVEYRDTR